MCAPHSRQNVNPYTELEVQRINTGNRDLGLTRMVNITVPLPPLAEQHRIVARVGELMGLLNRLEARLTATKAVHAAFGAAAVHSLDLCPEPAIAPG